MVFFNIFVSITYIIAFILCIIAIHKKNSVLDRISNLFILVGYLAHSLILFLNIFHDSFLSKGQFYFSLFGWSIILVFLFLIWKMKIKFLSLMISPLALIFFISSNLINTKTLPVPKTMSMLWFGTHIFCLFLSIAMVSVGFAVGIFYLYIHNQIKKKSSTTSFKIEGISLETLDRINHFVVGIGFPLFTIGILSGFIWASLTWHKIFSWDIKEVWSLVVWILFAYLFHQRMAIGWKGKKPAILIAWIFTLSLISFLVINSLFPTHHSFR
ncbi:cytochrome c biogenesis protein CcsA [Desulfothermus sp.]